MTKFQRKGKRDADVLFRYPDFVVANANVVTVAVRTVLCPRVIHVNLDQLGVFANYGCIVVMVVRLS